jgi:hypothetical protein
MRALGCWFILFAVASAATPIQLHPDNPHYFLFRGKATVLITSGEHYGAVLNLDFDYLPYLDELAPHKFNLTRVFSGSYREVPGSFNIVGNTLAPKPGRFICPWAEAAESTAERLKFDLEKWNPAYFERLTDLVREAGKRGIGVELVLFCTMYDDSLWNASPMNVRNNVNGIGNVGRYEVYSGTEERLTATQLVLTRKLVTELAEFDNVYFEICNEPYERGGLTKEWNDGIVDAIVQAEADLSKKHLIAQGMPHGEVKDLNPSVSVLNFHAGRPEFVDQDYHLAKAIADDETGGSAQSDRKYRTEGWQFMLAGGAVYDHLDFSFTLDREDGTAVPLPEGTPGGGGPELRKHLAVLKAFLEQFDFIEMRPANEIVKGQRIQPNNDAKVEAKIDQRIRVLAKPAHQYAIYVPYGTRAELELELPAGTYAAEWVSTRDGSTQRSEQFEHQGATRTLTSPDYAEDIALRLVRKERR